jgi:hypothetical protein
VPLRGKADLMVVLLHPLPQRPFFAVRGWDVKLVFAQIEIDIEPLLYFDGLAIWGKDERVLS